MKKITLTSFLMLFAIVAFAQTYTTPNTGVNWTLDDIAAASPTTITVSGTEYTLHENLEIAEADAVSISTDITLLIDVDLRITVFGSFTVDANAVSITAVDETMPYEGFRFEEFSEINIQNATIEYGGGLRVLTETFTLNNSMLSHNVSGVSTGAVVSLSRGMPQITNNTFTLNELPAVSSAANSQVSAYIFNNQIEANNQSNSNRPQINMGSTMANEPLQIIQNTIIGDPALTQVGGIAVANLVGGSINTVIDDNIIQGNRYGITIVGPSTSAEIKNNIIEDNNIQGNPNLGGSGININTSAAGADVIVARNEIRRNLWGITLQGLAAINLGDDATNEGLNVFSENENGGEVYALFNNTPNTIQAKHNCWIEGQLSTAQEVEDVISHVVDDPTLGEVIFDPFECSILGVEENTLANFSFYPNPVEDKIIFNNIYSFEKVEIFGIQGSLIATQAIAEGQNELDINLATGLYFAKFSNNTQSVTRKLMVK